MIMMTIMMINNTDCVMEFTDKSDDGHATLVALAVVLELVGSIKVANFGRLLLQTGRRTVHVLARLLAARPNHLHRLGRDGVVGRIRCCVVVVVVVVKQSNDKR